MAQVLRHISTSHDDPALLVGIEAPDDAAVYEVAPGLALVQTVDFFTPIVDDPYDWGRIAAANSLSDIYAMGGTPRTALNLVGWPRELDMALLGRVLEGALDICDEADTRIVGGHSIDDPEPKFGQAVTGLVDPAQIVRKTGATPGDALVITKPLGTGIVSHAIKHGSAPDGSARPAIASMTRLNRDAARAMAELGASAATDVTGFGLIGHLAGMLGDALDAHLRSDALPLLPGVLDLAAAGIYPGGSARNREAGLRITDVDAMNDRLPLLFDAQTSGGLLIAIAPERADELVDAAGPSAAVIGRVAEGAGRVKVT